MAKSIDEVSEILQKLKFRRRIFGGVDEEDVWRILGKLQGEYAELLSLEQAKRQALLEDRDRTIRRLAAGQTENKAEHHKI
jgi:hypothetical protein